VTRLGALLLVLTMAGQARPAAQRTVTVAVAANLKPAFEEIGSRLQASHPGVEVKAVYGASGSFLAQISNGAPFDLFLSADADFPAKAAASGLADGKPFVYAYGRLVVWVPRNMTLDFSGKGLSALGDPAVQKIAIANPDLAPYGRAARAALIKAGLYDRLRDRIVMGESVAQTAQFAQSGNAQAAFLPLSLARTPPLSTDGQSWPVPPASYDRIEQAGVILKAAKEPALAHELAKFIQGVRGREVLEQFGYDLPAR